MSRKKDLTLIRAGFIPLVDCAVLVAAREQGFAERHGIELQLKKEVSWANIRDHVNVGLLDVAQMLAGMPVAQSLGINHVKVPTIAPMALGMGGNAITVSAALFEELRACDEGIETPLGAAKALRRVIELRRKDGRSRLSFGHVFPFSCHHYQLRYWMAAAGIHPDEDVRLVVIPPPYMVKTLEAGQVDGFCVGEPWNIQAADQGVGKILTRPAQFWPRGPEKVLGLQEKWAADNPEALAALIKALSESAVWVDEMQNHPRLAQILARADYLDVAEDVILKALSTDLAFSKDNANTAECEHALWLYAQMVRWGQVPLSDAAQRDVCRTYRPDILADAVGALQGDVGTCAPAFAPLDGVYFDATDITGYISAVQSR